MKLYKLEKQSIEDYSNITEDVLSICISECNLECINCNVKWLGHGKKILVNSLLEEIGREYIQGYLPDTVLITGGEPLLYFEAIILCNALISLGKDVIIKTNGSAPIENIPKEVVKIVSYKLTSSGEKKSFYFENILNLTKQDFLRFNIFTEQDLKEAFEFLINIDFSIARFTVAFFINNKNIVKEDFCIKFENEFVKNDFPVPKYFVKVIGEKTGKSFKSGEKIL